MNFGFHLGFHKHGNIDIIVESWSTELAEVWVDELANEWTNG